MKVTRVLSKQSVIYTALVTILIPGIIILWILFLLLKPSNDHSFSFRGYHDVSLQDNLQSLSSSWNLNNINHVIIVAGIII